MSYIHYFCKMIKKVVLSVLISFPMYLFAQTSEDTITLARSIHNKVLTLDSHTDTPLRFLNTEFDVGKRNDPRSSKIDLPRMKEGGLDAAFFAVFLGQRERTPEGNKKVIQKTYKIFEALHSEIKKYPDLAEIATEPEDAYMLEKEGKRAIYIG